MKELFRILKRFVPPYKHYLTFNVVANILSALLSLFSFALLIPILQILFKIDSGVYQYVDWNFSFFSLDSWKEMVAALKNNFYYWTVSNIESYGEAQTLVFLGLFLIVMTFLKTGTAYLAAFYMIPIRTGVVKDIRNQINTKILSLPLGFFSEERKGDIIARISGDVNEIETSIMSSLDMLFKNPIMITIYIVGMVAISWQLTLFVLVLLPVSGFVMGQIGKKLKRQSLEGQNQWGELISQIEETLGGLRIIKAFNAEKKICDRFERSNNIFRRTINRINRRQQLAHPMSEFLGTATMVVVLWYGGSLILGNSSAIDAPTFIYYLIIFYSLINPAKELSKSIYSIQKGFASMERVDKILKAENTIKNPENPKAINFGSELKFSDVWFRYREEWVLREINLSIPKGATVALVGQSGSGKSTMVDLIPRFYDIEKGKIAIDGIDIKECLLHDLRGLMGNVNQEAILFNDTFYNNITFGVDNATQDEVIQAAKIANAHEFISASENGYDTNIGDRGSKLSGGQRQRISIARAILKNPPILILDEATSALDTESERLVQEALENLMRNRTTIVVAHRLSTIHNADLICVLHEGRIVERGKHQELYDLNGYYRRLCDMQQF